MKQFYLLNYCRFGGERGHYLFDSKLTKAEQTEFLRTRHPGEFVRGIAWIDWNFTPINVETVDATTASK